MTEMPAYSPKRAEWSQKLNRLVKAQLGICFFEEATLEEDCNQATDFKVYHLPATGLDIGARVRSFDVYQNPQYRHEVTIRSESNGHETEIHKILKGWGDFLFYGIASADERKLVRYSIINLTALRFHWNRISSKKTHINPDKVTGFIPLDLRELDSFQSPRLIRNCDKELRDELDRAKRTVPVKKPVERINSFAAEVEEWVAKKRVW